MLYQRDKSGPCGTGCFQPPVLHSFLKKSSGRNPERKRRDPVAKGFTLWRLYKRDERLQSHVSPSLERKTLKAEKRGTC